MRAVETWVAATVVGLLILILCIFGVRTAIVGRKIDARVAAEGGTALLGAWPLEAFHWTLRGVGSLLVKLRVSPDALTILSLVVSFASIPLVASGRFATAAAVFLVGSMFDAFDGIVARKKGIASDAGEVLDAFVDRYADAAPLVGLAIFYGASAWQMTIPLVALMGSMMVSYTRAKAEAMDVKLPPGMMRRHERIAYVGVALVVGPLSEPYFPAISEIRALPTLAIVAFVAVMTNISAVRLVRALRLELAAAGRGPRGKV